MSFDAQSVISLRHLSLFFSQFHVCVDCVAGEVKSTASSKALDNCLSADKCMSTQWRRNDLDGVSNHQPHHCLLNRLFRRRSKKRSKLCVTGLCARKSPVTGEFPTQMASNTENVSIWWCHNVLNICKGKNQWKWWYALYGSGNDKYISLPWYAAGLSWPLWIL